MAEEKRFENQVKRYLDSIGAWYLKTISNGYQRAGIPDLLICYKGRFLGVELKAKKGKATPLQEYELKQIRQSGGLAFVLYPDDFVWLKKLMEEII